MRTPLAPSDRLPVVADDQRPEQRRAGLPAMQHRPVAPGTRQRIVEAVQRRRGHLGHGEQRDDGRCVRCSGHGTNVRFVARNTLVVPAPGGQTARTFRSPPCPRRSTCCSTPPPRSCSPCSAACCCGSSSPPPGRCRRFAAGRCARSRLRALFPAVLVPAAAVGRDPGAAAAVRPGRLADGGRGRGRRARLRVRRLRLAPRDAHLHAAVAAVPPDAPQLGAARRDQRLLVQPARHGHAGRCCRA